MTNLTITPDVERKRLKVAGKVASGEKVAVTVLGFGQTPAESLRLRVMAGRTPVGVFPLDDADEWTVLGDDLTCELNLATEQAERLCRFGAETCLMLEDTATPQLYGVCDLTLLPWPKFAGVDVPVDLDNYKVKIGGLEKEISRIRGRMDEFEDEVGNANEVLGRIGKLKGIEVKTNTMNGMRSAIKAIAQALGAAKVSSIALMCALAAGGAEVHTAPLGELDLDLNPAVVTAVSFDGLASDARLDSATNAVTAVFASATNDLSRRVDSSAQALGMVHSELQSEIAGGTNALALAVSQTALDGTNYVNYAALTLASDIGSRALQSHYAATSNDVATLGTSVSAVWEQVFGDSVWIAVTNYMRTTATKPSMGLWERRDGQTNLVWSSSEEIGARVDALRADVTNAVQSAKAWGKWQSADGSAAVSNYTMVSTPWLMLTGGGRWEQRTVEGGGSYWLFCGNGLLGGTDETFKMMDSQGESVFEVTQGSVREVPAIPTSFKVVRQVFSEVGGEFIDVKLGVYATSQPKLYYSTSSPTGPWSEETVCNWVVDGGTNYVANPMYPTSHTTMFFKAVYETGAESTVDFKRPLKFPKLSIGGTNYAVSVGTMEDGTKFLKLEGE